ncbi:hypothetical protein [Nocardia terpenica]|uniref:Uncharacterized protein n=1 Tax=Nocardia terpenica TaxID=455432 RepID=A0A291RU97_9NOCA|nr:hypothetical protein [Nocardia terpenica]ATL70828.1 hypothetical protein CRH09_36255 [Nocardia terpenica]
MPTFSLGFIIAQNYYQEGESRGLLEVFRGRSFAERDRIADEGCPYFSDFARRPYLEGYRHGLSRALFALLHERKIGCTLIQFDRIQSEGDLDRLRLWIERASTAHDIDTILAG